MSKKRIGYKSYKIIGRNSSSGKSISIYRDTSTGQFVTSSGYVLKNPKSKILIKHKGIVIIKYKGRKGDGTDHTGPRRK